MKTVHKPVNKNQNVFSLFEERILLGRPKKIFTFVPSSMGGPWEKVG